MNNFNMIYQILTVLLLIAILVILLRDRFRIIGKPAMVLIDTSVLMDGRISIVAETGFMQGALVVPRSVVKELQLLADGSDHDKRSRARFGLSLISELQQMERVNLNIIQDEPNIQEGVDERLLKLAKRYKASLCTLDFNLEKVAIVEGIPVLNLNELAQGLRMAHLPGEKIVVSLKQRGSESNQAVGYLVDGTMVVVEQASRYLGKSIEVDVVRSLQTSSGRMIFAKVATNGHHEHDKSKPIRRNDKRGAEAKQKLRAKPQGKISK